MWLSSIWCSRLNFLLLRTPVFTGSNYIPLSRTISCAWPVFTWFVSIAIGKFGLLICVFFPPSKSKLYEITTRHAGFSGLTIRNNIERQLICFNSNRIVKTGWRTTCFHLRDFQFRRLKWLRLSIWNTFSRRLGDQTSARVLKRTVICLRRRRKNVKKRCLGNVYVGSHIFPRRIRLP